MASSLFGSQPTPQPNNLIGMVQQFNQFKASLSGKDPKAIVESMISSGQMSKQQFDQLAQMANQLQGIFK